MNKKYSIFKCKPKANVNQYLLIIKLPLSKTWCLFLKTVFEQATTDWTFFSYNINVIIDNSISTELIGFVCLRKLPTPGRAERFSNAVSLIFF